MAQNK